ncbi:hypothetical protein NKG94_31920 [Micromonospora sp. M12]
MPAVTGLTIPNGPAFDATGTTMYLADTRAARSTGSLSTPPPGTCTGGSRSCGCRPPTVARTA